MITERLRLAPSGPQRTLQLLELSDIPPAAISQVFDTPGVYSIAIPPTATVLQVPSLTAGGGGGGGGCTNGAAAGRGGDGAPGLAMLVWLF